MLQSLHATVFAEKGDSELLQKIVPSPSLESMLPQKGLALDGEIAHDLQALRKRHPRCVLDRLAGFTQSIGQSITLFIF